MGENLTRTQATAYKPPHVGGRLNAEINQEALSLVRYYVIYLVHYAYTTPYPPGVIILCIYMHISGCVLTMDPLSSTLGIRRPTR